MKKAAALLSALLVLSLTACGNPENSDRSVAAPNIATSHNYIANRNSGKLHYYTCDSLPAEHNRVYFSSESEANSAGYTNAHKECMGH